MSTPLREIALMTLQELLSSNTALPSIPKTIASLLSELDRPEPDLWRVSALINTDPVLAARMLQLANSAQFQLSNKISNVSEALAVAGLEQVRGLATSAAIAGAFQRVGGIDMQRFWRYSLDVAKLSRLFASLLWQNKSTAFTAGLIHATGELVLHLGMADAMAALNASGSPFDAQRSAAERAHLGFDYADVGAGFAQKWQFPQTIVDALTYQCRPTDSVPAQPVACILHLAAWRIRANESNFSEQEMAQQFPQAVADALELDASAVLDKDLIEWTSPAEIAALL